MGRIVDWVDQALLINHLPPHCTGRGAAVVKAGDDRTELRTPDDDELFCHTLACLGVRSATDLLDLLSR